jgi:hypothetical protein
MCWRFAESQVIMSSNNDDLSDVIPLGITIGISDGVQEMWMGRRICEIQGYGEEGWTTEMMLDYFTDLCKVYDAWAESKAPWIIPDDWDDVTLPEGISNLNHPEIRNYAVKVYNQFPDRSMNEVLRKLGVTPAEWFWVEKFADRVKSELTTEKVDIVESYFTQIHRPYEVGELVKETGLLQCNLDIMRDIFAERRIHIHGEEARKVDRAPAMLRQLVLEGKHKTPEILRMVYEATGVKFSKSWASKIRVRARNNQNQ